MRSVLLALFGCCAVISCDSGEAGSYPKGEHFNLMMLHSEEFREANKEIESIRKRGLPRRSEELRDLSMKIEMQEVELNQLKESIERESAELERLIRNDADRGSQIWKEGWIEELKIKIEYTKQRIDLNKQSEVSLELEHLEIYQLAETKAEERVGVARKKARKSLKSFHEASEKYLEAGGDPEIVKTFTDSIGPYSGAAYR